ncbi:MAG: hypothetical protein IMZ64_05735 [Bacteroidetes bacterium]|nr:hypothetical protein [Bacteroidota bacterium]
MNYTKGEWKTEYRRHENGMYSQDVFDEEGKTIAILDWHAVQIDDRTIGTDREANAHLIAAAPNMYEVLRERHLWYIGKSNKTLTMIQEMEIDALNKAEGK